MTQIYKKKCYQTMQAKLIQIDKILKNNNHIRIHGVKI